MMLSYQTLIININTTWVTISPHKNAACINCAIQCHMVLSIIGMTCNCFGNMLFQLLKSHQVNTRSCWLKPTWIQLSIERKCLKYFLKSFKYRLFLLLFKECFHCNIAIDFFRFATGKSTGIVLDSGDGVTHVVPVYEGYVLNHSCERVNLGGRDVTEHLKDLMRKSGVNFNTSAEFELVKNIK